MIAVASSSLDDRQLARIRDLLGEQDRLVLTTCMHDIGQVAEAAALARGEFLFFAESHVWPSPDVLERSLRQLELRPDWAALNCGLKRAVLNRLGNAEADMYQQDFKTGSATGWRNINDAGFFTRRAAYVAVGGLDVALGHFAEWLLSARYATEGLVVGMCPDITLTHLYSGDVAGLRAFTEDFVRGEITYLARNPGTHRERLIQSPREWTCRGNQRRDLAAHVVRLVVGEVPHVLAERRRRMLTFRLALGWAPIMFAGAALPHIAAVLRVLTRRTGLFTANWLAGKRALARAFRRYIEAVIHRARLRSADELRARWRPPETGELWSPYPEHGDVGAGLHDLEQFGDVAFRWSEPAGVIEFHVPPGRYTIHVNMLWARLANRSYPPKFYLNGEHVTELDVSNEGNSVNFTADVRRLGPTYFGWICARAVAPGDSRLLGLPFVSILAVTESS